ncbi:MAG: adenylate/guanylate cyclase domain-containing protein [Gammaproteobacteria bacterium]|nr:adenylate/guanylate cyclase domain-containing protein [Gammaproteobacteria bacterium]
MAVILHADVVSSTALVQINEVLAHTRIQAAFNTFSETIKNYGGVAREIRGDALVAELERASDAVTAAIEFQIQNKAENVLIADGIKPSLRIGISLGEVIVADNTITGEGVVLAQRLEQLADPGGVVVQGSVSETVPTRMPFEFDFLGEQELKGFDNLIRAFSVSLRSGEELPASDSESTSRTVNQDNSPVPSEPTPVVYEALIGESLKLPEVPSIAVLPFQNMSGDPDQEYFADGIAEDIITTLSLVPDMVVIARNSTFVYKGRSVDVRQVGKDLGVGHVLEGSIRKSGNRVRITAQLVDTLNGDHVWAERYDRELDDIFAIQDEITHNIVIELQVNLGKGEASRLIAGGTSSVEAWELGLRAGPLIESNSRDDSPLAKKLIKQALAIDSHYSSAWEGLALIYWHEAVFKWNSNPDESLEKALDAAQKAISSDENNPGGYSMLGNVYLVQGKAKQARETCEKAVETAPGNSFALVWLANVLCDSGQISEALKLLKRAIRLCPFPPAVYFWGLGLGYHLNGENERAVIVLRLAIERNQDALMPRLWLASALVELERLDEAQEIRAAALEIEPNFSAAGFAENFKSKSHARLKDNLLAAGLPE